MASVFLKMYKPTVVSLRNKKKIISIFSSLKTHIKIKRSFFRKKIANNHKFLNNTNSILKLNLIKTNLLGSYFMFNWIKVNYTNTFYGFFLFHNNSITIKPCSYGFSFDKIHKNYFLTPFLNRNKRIFGEKYKNIMGYNFLIFYEINSIFYFVHDFFSNKYFAKSAGTYCLVLNFNKSNKFFLVRLPSKKKIMFDYFVIGFLGRASNIFSKYTFYSSFKEKLLLKKHSPKVRGVAKNPIDHPNGGRSKVKKPFLTPWGKIAKKGK